MAAWSGYLNRCCCCFAVATVLLSALGAGNDNKAHGQAAHTQHALVLDEETTYEIKSRSEAELVFRRRVKVFDQKGKYYGYVYAYESDLVGFDDFSGKVYDAAGNLIYDFGKSDGDRICGQGGYSLYEDICIYNYILTCTSYPFTIEYEYRLKHKTLLLWPDWRPEAGVPVQESSYRLIVPKSFAFDSKTVGEIPEPEVSEKDGKLVYDWSLRELPALDREDHTPEYTLARRCLRFSPVQYQLGKYEFSGSSWAQLSAAYDKMIADRFELSGEQRDVVELLQAATGSPREFCDSLHRYLQSRTRYVAIEIGVGGWLPSKAKETYERGYGDCKDLSMMYVAMLRRADIVARPTVIRTKSRGATDPDFPTLSDFNHVILFAVLDGDTVWVDPTCEYCPFGDLPADVEDAWALLIDPELGDIIKTPASQPADNLVCRRALVSVSDDRVLNVMLRLDSRGNPAHRLSSAIANLEPHQLQSRLESELFGLSDKINVDSVVPSTPTIASGKGSLVLYGHINNAIHSLRDSKYVDVTFLSSLCDGEQVDLSDRKQCVDLLYPRTYTDTLSLVLPTDFVISQLPTDTTFGDGFCDLSFASTMAADKLQLICHRSITRYFVEPSDFPAFAASIARRKAFLPSHIVLERRD